MGTFHQDRGELHGITVAVETSDRQVFVGRCDTVDIMAILLHDADQHREGENGTSNEDYLRKSAMLGVWKKHDSLRIPTENVTSLRPLADYLDGYPRDGAPLRQPESESGCAPVTPLSSAMELRDDQQETITFSETARQVVTRLLQDEAPGQSLRLAVKDGGCSGYTYILSFDTANDDDVMLDCTTFQVIMDQKSSTYFNGVTLDHEGGLNGRGFVFSNPNARKTCSCGESFAV